MDKYDKKYKYIFKTRRKEIIEWADGAIEKLHGMSDEELLKYFPDTTPEELEEFRKEENGKV